MSKRIELSVETSTALPCLGWTLQADFTSGAVKAIVGTRIEHSQNWAVEGAWDGDFEDMGFIDSENFTGSGFKLDNEGLMISSSTCPAEPVYYCIVGNHIYCSNHIVTLLAHSGLRLIESYPYYDRLCQSASLGTDRALTTLPTLTVPIELMYQGTIKIETDSEEVHCVDKPMRDVPLKTFKDYRDAVSAAIEKVIQNAADPRRKHPKRSIASISSGYDGAAVAVLAKDSGHLIRTITLTTPRAEFEGSDSGEKVAQQLGLECITVDPGSRSTSDTEELERWTIASMFGGEDIVWVGPHEQLKGSMLLSGMNGDSLWSMKRHSASRYCQRGGVSGSSLLGLRLKSNFFHFCPLYAFSNQQPEIIEISNSAEMKTWTLNNSYDRPIPRRILEEAGVSRTNFGLSKKAASDPLFYTDGRPANLQAISDRYRLRFENASGTALGGFRYRDTLLSSLAKSIAGKLVKNLTKHAPKNLRDLGSLVWVLEKQPEVSNLITPWTANQLANETTTALEDLLEPMQ